MDILHEVNVKLSKKQKVRLYKAFRKRKMINIWLRNDALTGSDTLLVPSVKMPSKFIHPYDGREIPLYTIIDHLETERKGKKGMEITMNYACMCDSIKYSVAKNLKKFISLR